MLDPTPETIAFGKLVRQRRKALGLTQIELGLLVDTGERFVSELERGKPTCQLGKALVVAAKLEIRFEAAEGDL
jgi:HTH-type transcriptional regulator/antitoxin HipB